MGVVVLPLGQGLMVVEDPEAEVDSLPEEEVLISEEGAGEDISPDQGLEDPQDLEGMILKTSPKMMANPMVLSFQPSVMGLQNHLVGIEVEVDHSEDL